MTNNPSSSVPVSKGEEILSMFEALVYGTIRPRDSRIKLVSLIDSALASQEARHAAQLEAVLMGEPWEGRYVHLLLCNGGYQKPGTPGLICNCPIYRRILTAERALRESEARHRQEMEEAKREHHAAVKWHDCPGCLRYFQQDQDGAMENARLTQVLEKIAAVRCGIPGHSVAVGCKASSIALAAIRCAPSPVSAPPTETGPRMSPEMMAKAERARKFFVPVPEDEGGDDPDYGLLDPASPVEPGSDPQEPETR